MAVVSGNAGSSDRTLLRSTVDLIITGTGVSSDGETRAITQRAMIEKTNIFNK